MRYGKTIKYAFHVIFHPFDGFWDLKREQRGSLAAALTFVALTIITLTLEKQKTAFLFNPYRLDRINVMVDVITVLLLYVLWCVANWCLTSLMDGEGKLKDIAIATGYALFPVILLRLPMILISYMLTSGEGSFYDVIGVVSYLWAGALLILGTMITHQYSVKKTLLTCICTIVGMGIIMFIGLLFFNVIQQMMTFVSTIYEEIRFR
ncbi:MAG: YIP1 family protein [Lachnospiraceae bacterium]|nr:YIP1 family protein [Lachnospiraceae bacterium]MBP3609871.1 YIP1 family protein [Lachnospiraceae bacterium]